MATFLCVLVHGPTWDDARGIREQARWDEHAAFMDGLVNQGCIVVGGPVGSGETTVHLVDATDEHAVRARLAGDPWAREGLVEIGILQSWTLWLDARHQLPVIWGAPN